MPPDRDRMMGVFLAFHLLSSEVLRKSGPDLYVLGQAYARNTSTERRIFRYSLRWLN